MSIPNYAPSHPGSPTLSEDVVLNHNITQLYSHCGQQLGIKNGRLFVTNNSSSYSTPLSKITRFVNNLFKDVSVFSSLGFDANRHATLFNPSEKEVRKCALDTLDGAAQMIRGKNSDTVVCLLDKNPFNELIPQNIRRALEILYLDGVTPFTYNQLTELLNIEITEIDLPPSLKENLLNLKAELAKFEWFHPMIEISEIDVSTVEDQLADLNLDLLEMNLPTPLRVNLSYILMQRFFKTTPPSSASSSTTPDSNDSLTARLRELNDSLETSEVIQRDPNEEINGLLNVSINALTDFSPEIRENLTVLKGKLQAMRTSQPYTDVINSLAIRWMRYDTVCHQLDRKGWLYTTKRVEQLVEQSTSGFGFSGYLQFRYFQQLLTPWKKINKEKVNNFIDSDFTRSFMDDPACRVVTKEHFIIKLGNLFSMNSVNMHENFPQFYERYHELNQELFKS